MIHFYFNAMATVTLRFSCVILRYTCRIPSRRKPLISPVASRLQSFHTSSIYRDDLPRRHKPYVFKVSSLTPQARDHYNSLSPEERLEYEEASTKLDEYMTSPEVESKLHQSVSQAVDELEREEPQLPPVENNFQFKSGFFAMGEDEPQDVGEDEKFEGDDITSTAHAQLEQHREIREYMRIAAWEMPMLSSPSSIPVLLNGHERLIGS